MVPAIANRRIDDGAKRDGAQLFGDALGIEAFGIGVVAKDLEKAGAVVEMRDCIFENRAPLPGPCQAFAEKASGARMAARGRRGGYRTYRSNWDVIEAFDMAMDVRTWEWTTSEMSIKSSAPR